MTHGAVRTVRRLRQWI